MKKILFVIIFLWTVSSCGISKRMADVSGIYQSLRYEETTHEFIPNNYYLLILNKNGTFLDVEYCSRFIGTWTFVQKNVIELKYTPGSTMEELRKQFDPGYVKPPLDWKIEVINKDSLRMKGGIFERIK